MIIQFGLELDEQVAPDFIQTPEEVGLSCGVKGLLSYLEKHLGIFYPERQDYLRYEQYRQLLAAYMEEYPQVFFAQSFKADGLATAVEMLDRRDELLLGGWDFALEEGMPSRLQVFAELEQLVMDETIIFLFDGFAERFLKVTYWLGRMPIPLEKIYLNESFDLLPTYLQRLFKQLEAMQVSLIELDLTPEPQAGDLSNFQQALLKKPYTKQQVQADGSLIIVQCRREIFAAEYFAKLFAKNKDYRPVCLIPQKDRALDNSLVEEGLPSFGILSASLARPTLQILKLANTFLWRPIDPYKILEFVSLPSKPIHKKLAREIAKVIAEKPGLNSPSWRKMIASFFSYYDEQTERSPKRRFELEQEEKKVRKQFNKWFNRRRYDSNKAVPKGEAIDLYTTILIWTEEQLDENKKEIENIQQKIDAPSTPHHKLDRLLDRKEDLTKRQNALQGLLDQTQKLIQILETLPEKDTHLSYLRLERLVRTINEPAAMRFRKSEVGHLPFVYHSSAIVRPTDQVFWWNFIDTEQKTGFPRWYLHEQQYLNQKQVGYDTPQQKNQRQLWQRKQAFLKCQQQLVLVLPQFVEGKEQLPHPLWGDLCAALGEANLSQITVDLEQQSNIKLLEQFFETPALQAIEPIAPRKTPPFISIDYQGDQLERSRESFSSLRSLLYYPYQWFFKYKADFKKSAILSISKERRLKGNLAHNMFEALLNAIIDSGNRPWSKEEVQQWVGDYMPGLLEREGAVLLMYGFEPERIGLIDTLTNAAWVLVSTIQNNGWKVEATEQLVEGKILDQPLFGYVDVVLSKGDQKAIIDLKWAGARRRKDDYINNLDLQLVIYSNLLDKTTDWAHTAYFIIKDGLFIARNNLAFEEAEAVCPEADFREVHHNIWHSIAQTYTWRMQQLKEGMLAVPTEETFDELEEMQREEAMESSEWIGRLEMKNQNAYFDDYTVLINLAK